MNKFSDDPRTTDSRPAIVPWGGAARTTLPLLEENHHHQTTGDDHYVGTNLGFSRNSAIAPDNHDLDRASNPTALDDQCATVSRNGPPPPKTATPPRWFLPDVFDGVEEDEVDTTLSLWPPGTNTKELKTRMSAAAYIPPPPVHNPTPLRWFLPGFFDGAEEDNVDTTLSLRPPGTTTTNKSRKPPEIKTSTTEEAAARRLSKRDEAKTSNQHKIKRGRFEIINTVDEKDERPLIPYQELLRTIGLRGGTGAVFLYRKDQLDDSDVGRQNRRVVLRGIERSLMKFLSKEETAAVVDGRGLEIVGVDSGGNVYGKLVLTTWPSLGAIVIRSPDWMEVVAKNNADKGDMMEIWGYRENAKPCLGFNLRVHAAQLGK